MPRNDAEHTEQVFLFQWAAAKEGQIPQLANLYAVPNGSYKSKAQAGRFRAEGLKAGVPDVCLAVARIADVGPAPHEGGVVVSFDGKSIPLYVNVYGSLYIEMKAPDKHPRPDQRAWADRLEAQGMRVVRRCTSWQDAARHCLEYLGIEVTRRKFPELFV